jgi:hypothetical protein
MNVAVKPLGRAEEYPLETWAFRFVCYGGCIMTTVKSVINFFTINAFFRPFVTFAFAIFLFVLFRKTRTNEQVERIYWVLIAVTLAFFSLNWLWGEGSKGPVTTLYIVSYCFVLFAASKKARFLTGVCFMTNILLLMISEMLWPELYTRHSLFASDSARILDHFMTLLISLPAIAWLISYALYCYNHEKEKERISKDELLSSITYASLIQQSFLPELKSLDVAYQEHFLIWKPKDILGGDFYWHHNFDDDSCITVVGDCTGHGVPGAMMTVFMISMLNQIIVQENIRQLELIARLMDERIHQELNIHNKGMLNGADVFLLRKDKSGIYWLGCNLHAFCMQGQNIVELKAQRCTLGQGNSMQRNLYPQTITTKNNLVWIFWDGVSDQNGLSSNSFALHKSGIRELMLQWHSYSALEQKELWELALAPAIASKSQRDDITLLGIKV